MSKIKRFSLIIICALFICTSFIFVGCKDNDDICKLYVFSSVGGHVQVDGHKEVVEFGDEGSKMFTYKEDTIVTLKAVADAGYQFVRWQFNDELEEYEALKDNAEIKIEIDDDAVIKAEFEIDASVVRHNVTYPVNQIGYSFLIESGYTTTVLNGDNFKFKINLLENYSNSNIVVKANGSTLVAENGIYTISNITSDINITVEGVVENQPESVEIYEIFTNDTSYTILPVGQSVCKVEKGNNFTFTIQLKEGYKFGENVVVKANGVTINAYNGEYTITSITSDIEIIVRGIEEDIPTNPVIYEVYDNDELFTIIPVNQSTCEVVQGESFTFTVQVKDGYRLSDSAVVKAGNTILTPSNGEYTIGEVTSNIEITIDGIEENVVNPEPDPEPEPEPTIYTILTNDTTYTIEPVGQSKCEVEEGESFTFTIKLKDGYKFSDTVEVKANENILTHSNGEYTIENIMENIEITVEGIVADVVNPEPDPEPDPEPEPEPEPQPTIYTISTNETTYTIEPVGQSTCEVEEGKSFTFTIKLKDGYKFSDTIEVSANGNILTSNNDEYTIDSVTVDITITVNGIEQDINVEESAVYSFEMEFQNDKEWALTDIWQYVPQNFELEVDDSLKQSNQYLAQDINLAIDGGTTTLAEMVSNINNYLSTSAYSGYSVTSFKIGDIEFISINGENAIFNWDVLSLIDTTETLTIIITE